MKRDLLFIKAFRPIQGIDGEIQNLEEADLTDISTKGGVYIIRSYIISIISYWNAILLHPLRH